MPIATVPLPLLPFTISYAFTTPEHLALAKAVADDILLVRSVPDVLDDGSPNPEAESAERVISDEIARVVRQHTRDAHRTKEELSRQPPPVRELPKGR